MKLLERFKALWSAICAMDEPEAEFVGNMQRVVYNEGDVIVISTDARLSSEHIARIREHMSPLFAGSKVLVLDQWLKLGVVGMSQMAEANSGTH